MNGANNPRAKKAGSQATGILVLDKPRGRSSMSAVAIVRRRAGGTRTGHAGTLDPLATGVLVVALGRATKCIDRLMATPKRYRTVIDLSAFTTTDDLEGDRREVIVAAPPDIARVREVLDSFVGTIRQRPPAFSAVKVRGRRAYALAREGTPVDLPAREATVHGIDLIRYDWPELEIDVRCAKGLYIRSLARDVGLALGTGGHCTSLRRTAVGPFDESMAVALDDVPDPLAESDLMPVEVALRMIEESAD